MAVAVTQYRFGINEGNEATHGWHGAQNTAVVLPVGVAFLLRVNMQDSGTGTGPPLIGQLYYSLNGGSKTIAGSASNVIRGAATVLTEDGDCTQRLTGGTGTFLSNNDGQTESTGMAAGVGGGGLAAGGCTEFEFGIQIMAADVAHGDTIDFYVYINGGQATATVTPRVYVSKNVVADTWSGFDSKASGRADGPWFTASR